MISDGHDTMELPLVSDILAGAFWILRLDLEVCLNNGTFIGVHRLGEAHKMQNKHIAKHPRGCIAIYPHC